MSADLELGGIIAPIVRGMSETLLRRPVKTYDQATGEPVRDVTMRQLIGGLAKVTALELEVIEGRRPKFVQCENCGREVMVSPFGLISRICRNSDGGCGRQTACAGGCGAKPTARAFSRNSVKVRRGSPWQCKACRIRETVAARTTEQRSAAARKGHASRTTEQKAEAIRKGHASRKARLERDR